MISPRSGHVAVRLADGRVLVAGGVNGSPRLATAELFNPATGAWSAAGSMAYPRLGHAAVRLSDGRVLVVGGTSAITCTAPPVGTSAEIYNPATGNWSATGSMQVARNSPAIALLANGKVLVAGGGNRCGGVWNSAELYDPATGQWALTGSMSGARQSAAAVRLADGRVLVAGGIGGNPYASLRTAELYDPATGTWGVTGAMADPRFWTHEDMAALDNFLALLPDGRVLTAGGVNRCDAFGGCSVAFLNTAELYNPATGAWTRTGAMASRRWKHQTTVLAGGQLVVTGGRNDASVVLNTVALYDVAAGTFTTAAPLLTARFDHTTTALADGRALIAGGMGGTTLSTAEIYAIVTNRAPVANPGAAVTGTEGAEVRFDGSASTDPDGDALSYLWNFGDGSPAATGANVSHVYADNGTYTVTLTVSDGRLTAGASTTATIANVAPAVSPLLGGALLPGETYHGSGSFTDPGADAWTATVDYGDGSGAATLPLAGTTFTLSHTYRVAGSYTLTVSVADDDGAAGASSATIVVSNRVPVADPGAAVTGTEGAEVRFDGSASRDPDGDALSYLWNFGDGGPAATGANVSHVYVDNGTYTVTLTVSDGRLTAGASTTATIANVAPAVGSLLGGTLVPGETYHGSGSFTDPGADAWTATVDYGDGSGAATLPLAGTTFTLSHTYRVAGSYTLTVTVADDDGAAGASRATVVVTNRAPVANPGAAVTGTEGAQVRFDGSASTDPDGDALSYLWNFGDGSPAATGANVSHVYADNGAYTVTLTVSDGRLTAGASTTATIANVAPAVSPLLGGTLLPGETYHGSGSFADPGADAWTATVDYGDGSGAATLPLAGTTFTLSHTYRVAGSYTLTVSVADDDGAVGASRATIVVQTPQQAAWDITAMVDALVASGALSPGSANSLKTKLRAATTQLDHSNDTQAVSVFDAFLNDVRAMMGSGRLAADSGQSLIDAVNRILHALRGEEPAVIHGASR